MSLVNGGNDLTEKRPRLRFSQPPSRPDIGMEVGETGRKEEVGLSITHYHFVNGVDVWVTVNPVVGCQHSATDWIVIDNLANVVFVGVDVDAAPEVATFQLVEQNVLVSKQSNPILFTARGVSSWG